MLRYSALLDIIRINLYIRDITYPFAVSCPLHVRLS